MWSYIVIIKFNNNLVWFRYEQYESEFEEGEQETVHEPQKIGEDLFNRIVWAPIIWLSWGFLIDCVKKHCIGNVKMDPKNLISKAEDVPVIS